MSHRMLVAIGIALTLVSPAFAQDGLRSASLPERPVATPPPGPEDLFRATPNTYRPHNQAERPRPHGGRGAVPRPPQRPVYGGGSRWRYQGGWPYVWQPEPEPARIERELPVEGRLQLRIVPGEALVYIDGGFEGTADSLRDPGALLRAGSHRVRIDATGLASHTFDVRIDEGETVTHRAALDRDGPAPVTAPPALARSEPRVLYVIPRCYAGDKPPDPATRCDLTQLRTIR